MLVHLFDRIYRQLNLCTHKPGRTFVRKLVKDYGPDSFHRPFQRS